MVLSPTGRSGFIVTVPFSSVCVFIVCPSGSVTVIGMFGSGVSVAGSVNVMVIVVFACVSLFTVVSIMLSLFCTTTFSSSVVLAV